MIELHVLLPTEQKRQYVSNSNKGLDHVLCYSGQSMDIVIHYDNIIRMICPDIVIPALTPSLPETNVKRRTNHGTAPPSSSASVL